MNDTRGQMYNAETLELFAVFLRQSTPKGKTKQVIIFDAPVDRGGLRNRLLWNFRSSISGSTGWRRHRLEPAPRLLLFVHRAEPANEPGTGECAFSQSCGGSALELFAFAVQEQVVEIRGALRCAHIELHLYACPTDG